MIYSQPDFYKFNEDSIRLVRFICKNLKAESFDNALDVCAGCGVIGIELSRSLNLSNLSFIEKQVEFISHIEKNINAFKVNKTQIYNLDILNFSINDKFDLIVMNPPYFEYSKTRKSPDQRRNTCRIIKEEKIKEILLILKDYLRGDGYFCMVVPDNASLWNQAFDLFDLYCKEIKNKNQYLIFKNK